MPSIPPKAYSQYGWYSHTVYFACVGGFFALYRIPF